MQELLCAVLLNLRQHQPWLTHQQRNSSNAVFFRTAIVSAQTSFFDLY